MKCPTMVLDGRVVLTALAVAITLEDTEMIRFKMSFLAVGLSVAVLVGIFGKLAIDHHLLWQNAEANSGSAEIDNRQKTLKNDEITAKATKTPWRSKITFQEALRIAEAEIGGKAYGIE